MTARSRLHFLLAASLVLLVACDSGDDDDDDATDPTVVVANNSFSPALLTVSTGTSVRFTWATGSTNHNVLPSTSNPTDLPESPGAPTLLDAPQSFDVTFNTVGTYDYYCSAHGSVSGAGVVSGMSGRVVVE